MNKKNKYNTMSFKNAQDLIASNTLNLSSTVRITKNDTDANYILT